MAVTTALPADELRAWLQLIRVPALGAQGLVPLLERYGSAAAVLAASAAAWHSAGVASKLREAALKVDTARLDADLEWLAGPRRQLLVWTDPRYPQRLREITSPPIALFALGDCDWLAMPQLAIVGSRNATPQGLENAQDFARTLASRGITITSGLALGIDGAAHRGALDAGGGTIAVCGTGLDRVYPAAHQRLAHEIAGQGLLLSEFPPGTAPRKEFFPRRNRIIAGLSLGVLVVEAARESGSLITARQAMEQGREVFAIPGSIHNVMARGCHQLIRQGAKLTETVDDILEELAGVLGTWLKPAAAPDLGEAGRTPPGEHPALPVLAAVGDEPTSIDALLQRCDLPPEEVHAALMQLELDGLVVSMPGGRVMRTREGNSILGRSR